MHPTFVETNMSNAELKLDLSKDGHRTLVFTCYVTGMPKPNVTWYRDNVVIEENDQFKFLYNDQELRILYWLEKDSGKYSCRAENRFGFIEAYQQVIIKGLYFESQ